MKNTTELGSYSHMSLSSQLAKVMRQNDKKVKLPNTAEQDYNINDDNAINKALDQLLASDKTNINDG